MVESPVGRESSPLSGSGLSDQESDSTYETRQLEATGGSRLIPNNRSSSVLRLVSFLLLEIGFLTFGLLCLLKPIPLPLSPDDDTVLREVKAITTAITVVWHALAAFMVQDLTVSVFSAECMAQYRRTGNLKPGRTDRVSTATASLLSRGKHFMSHTATPRYRVGFAAAIGLMALGPIGPAVLTVGSVSTQCPERIQLSTLDGKLYPWPASDDTASKRAELVLRMEAFENYTFGYTNTNETVLIPWPQLDLISREETITYLTDVVTYNYSCSWHAPVVDNPHILLNDTINAYYNGYYFNGYKLRADGMEWGMQVRGFNDEFSYIAQMPPMDPEFMVMPLVNTIYPGSLNSSLAGFIFFGGISPTIPSTSLLFSLKPPSIVSIQLLASALLCEPHFQVVSGEVHLEAGKLILARLVDESPLTGNFPVYVASVIFAQALVVAMEPTMPLPGDYLSDHAKFLFFDSGHNILPLKEINVNMNRYMQSAAKAYLNGAGTDPHSNQLSRRTPWNATRECQKPMLVTSRPFLIALTAIVASLAALLLSLLVMMPRSEIQLFDLHNFTVHEKPSIPKSECQYTPLSMRD